MGQNISAINPSPGGTQNKLNVTAVGVIKSAPGTIMRIVTQVVGTSGNLVINDLAANSGAAIANQLASIPFGSLAVGVPNVLEMPCLKGIVISAVPAGGWIGSISFF